MLSVTGGEFKGRSVRTVPRKATRYTPALARRALFDVIDAYDARFLDLFAGSGIVSLEAISRGASEVVCVEASKTACSTIRANRSLFELDDTVMSIFCMDFRRAIAVISRNEKTFDLVFADPPFEEGFLNDLIHVLGQHLRCFKKSRIVIETSSGLLEELKTAVLASPFSLEFTRSYSGVELVFLEVQGDVK